VRLADDELAKGQQSKGVRQARALLAIAGDDLIRALGAASIDAEQSLHEILFSALGPGITAGEVRGMQTMLAMLLDTLTGEPSG
jgi:hypothetical protein